MTEGFPGWDRKMVAVQNAVHWAASRVTTVFRDGNDGGRVREANQVWIELHLEEINSIGVDEERQGEPDEAAGELPFTQCGLRNVNIEIRAFSRSQEHDQAAWNALEQARLRLRSSYARDTWLVPNNLSIVDIGTLFNLPKKWQDRIEDQAVLEANFGTVVTDQDAANTGTWIDRVLVSSDLSACGVPLDGSLNLDDVVMGEVPYTPLALGPKLLGWWDSEISGKLFDTGDPTKLMQLANLVGGENSLSVNATDQMPDVVQSVVNGLPVLRWFGSGFFTTGTDLGFNTGDRPCLFVVAAYRDTVTAALQIGWELTGVNDVTFEGEHIIRHSLEQVSDDWRSSYVFDDGGVDGFDVTSGLANDADFHLFEHLPLPAGFEHNQDGVQVGGSEPAGIGPRTASSIFDSLVIASGVVGTGIGGQTALDFASAVLLSEPPSDRELLELREYLIDRYALPFPA